MMPSDEQYTHFKELFYKQYASLCHYASSIVGNRDDAEDVVQEVFIKVWQNRPDLVTTEQVKYYLFTATRNNCLTLLRRRKTMAVADVDVSQLEQVADEEPRRQPSGDLKALIANALEQLPPQCQRIFRLSRFGKLTYNEIAAEMGLSVKTVENQMGKALRILRTYMKQNYIPMLLLIELMRYL
jgi:RNA polymerase sigma-70 factor (ECF subfamily)